MKNKILNLIGFAQRAGKIISGEATAEASIKKGKAKLVLMADDTSSRVKKEIGIIAEKSNVPIIEIASKAELGLAIGKSPRAIVLVLDKQFAKAITDLHRSNLRGRDDF